MTYRSRVFVVLLANLAVALGAQRTSAQQNKEIPTQQEIEGALRGAPIIREVGPAPKPQMSRAATASVSAAPEPPSIALPSITFQFNSAELTPSSVKTLQNLGNALNAGLKDVKTFVIQGHTDKSGGEEYNKILSMRRAEAVKTYLVKNMGVAPERLEPVGLGYSQLVDSRRPYALENRRVVVVNTLSP